MLFDSVTKGIGMRSQSESGPGGIEILALRSYAAGYRGCLVNEGEYLFFQFTRKGRLKFFKSYPRGEFRDHNHFIAMMMKFITPSAFFRPPVPIEALTLDELDRVRDEIVMRKAL